MWEHGKRFPVAVADAGFDVNVNVDTDVEGSWGHHADEGSSVTRDRRRFTSCVVL